MQARAQASGQVPPGVEAPADDDDEVPDLIENFDAVEEEEGEKPSTKANDID
jgi:hypothetical protein